jgi:cytochrome oxidase complex assembly protein 1
MSSPPMTMPQAMPPQRGWWSRNWKWFVPTAIVGFIALVTAGIFGIVMLVLGGVKSAEPYQYAVSQAQHSPAVIQRLGAPIKEGMFFSGEINVNGASGDANLAIPISGPKGKATVYVVGNKSAGQWTYLTLEVQFEGDPNRISLLNPIHEF